MAEIKKLISIIILIAVLIIAPPAVSYAQSAVLTVDAAVDSAYAYSLIEDKTKLMQKDWESRLNSVKNQVNGINKLIEADDKIRKIKNYLEEEDYRSMRIDVVQEDFAYFLLIYGYIDYSKYKQIKDDMIPDDDFTYVDLYNDDQILKKYYEYQLKYLPDNLPDKDRIDMLSAKESSYGQAEAVIKQEKAKLEADKEKLRMDVVKTYSDLIMAQKSLDNAKNNVEESQKIVDKYKNLLEHGMIGALEYDGAAAELESKRNELEKAERIVNKHKTVLNVLMGRVGNSPVTIDENIKITDKVDVSYSELSKELEKENITLYVLRETVVNPAEAKYKIACEELKPADELFKDIQDAKDKAEMEYSQTLDKYKSAVTQQIRSIKSTQNSSLELQGEIGLMEQRINLVKSQIKAGIATELDLLRLQNTYNTMKTNLENLKYALDYQWQNLQYTVHY